jgi:hypothetical protein
MVDQSELTHGSQLLKASAQCLGLGREQIPELIILGAAQARPIPLEAVFAGERGLDTRPPLLKSARREYAAPEHPLSDVHDALRTSQIVQEEAEQVAAPVLG